MFKSTRSQQDDLRVFDISTRPADRVPHVATVRRQLFRHMSRLKMRPHHEPKTVSMIDLAAGDQQNCSLRAVNRPPLPYQLTLKLRWSETVAENDVRCTGI